MLEVKFSMNICFFLSDHGFGHIMRNLPVIREVIERGNKVVFVCGKRHIAIAEEYLSVESGIAREDYISIVNHTDVGLVVKPGTLLLDKGLTRDEVADYVGKFDAKIAFACNLFREYHIDRVVVDIVPWALLAAKEMKIPSYLMASFTWIEQYQGYVNHKDLDVLIKAFQSANNILYYDLANQPTRSMLGVGREIGFVCRPFHLSEVNRIKSKHTKPIVFLSLGASNSGLDFPIDVSRLPYDFITTEAIKLIGDNVTYLNSATPNTQDYVMAADYCISKAGWSTVSEMMIAGIKFAVLNRPDVPEDTMIISQLEDRKAAIGIDVDELKDMSNVMDKLETAVFSKMEYDNSYEIVTDIILGT